MKEKQATTTPKPTVKQPVPVKAATADERNEMFEFWFENDRNISVTAKKFSYRTRRPIYKIKVEDDWDGRARIIDKKVKAGIDRKLAAKQISNVSLVQKCLNREIAACLSKPKSKVAGSPQNIVLMATFVEKAQGNLPPETDDSDAEIDKVLMFEVHHVLGELIAGDKQPPEPAVVAGAKKP